MSKTTITNARIFNGEQILQATTLLIEDGVISSIGNDAITVTGTDTFNGNNGVLLPGLIDSHIHLHDPSNLKQLAQYGITTGLDMATWPPSLIHSLRAAVEIGGIADFRTPGLLACAPGSRHSHMLSLTADAMVASHEDAKRFVQARVDEGVAYIKIIADLPGFDQETLNLLVTEAKSHGKKVIAHAAHYEAFQRALTAKVDIITHVPTDRVVDEEICTRMLEQGTIAIPTLTMMELAAKVIKRPGSSFSNASKSVYNMYKAGIPILAGTDCNAEPGSPAQIKHGESLHHELELLVEAGMSTVDVLRAAGIASAGVFRLEDRGVIQVGKRADLVLIDGDPLREIGATRNIKEVWCRGFHVERL